MGVWLGIALGGAAGSLLRHVVHRAINHAGWRVTPYATATVNIVGCLIIGILAGLIAQQRITLSAETRAFLFVGVLGGFTTFSSLGLDTLTLATGGEPGLAALNVIGQITLGVAAAFAGYYLARL